MPDNDKLITLDNLGTFKDNIEEEIREGSLNTPEVIILSSTSGTLDSETLNKLKAHPAHYVLNVGGGNIYSFSVESGSSLQYDRTLITGSFLETRYLLINKATGDLSTGTTGPNVVEVVEYQTTTPLTVAQVAKAQTGKLAVLDDNKVFVLFSKDSTTVTFAAYTVSYQNGYYSQACYTLVQQRRVLTISSRMFTQASFAEYRMVADIVEDFIGNTDTPNASGKQVVRALNLRRTHDMISTNYYDATATYAVGDVVIYQNQLYKCTTAIETAEAWDATHWELTNVVELAQDAGANIVTVTTMGVQSDEMAAKIENAKSLYYQDVLYVKIYKDSTDDYFHKYTLGTAYDSGAELKYRRSTKTLSFNNQTYNKVATLGGAYGTVGVDASLTTAGSLPTSRSLKLTGKLPYLTTAPTADNTSGFLTIVVLSAEPDTRYSGYMYVITGSNS